MFIILYLIDTLLMTAVGFLAHAIEAVPGPKIFIFTIVFFNP